MEPGEGRLTLFLREWRRIFAQGIIWDEHHVDVCPGGTWEGAVGGKRMIWEWIEALVGGGHRKYGSDFAPMLWDELRRELKKVIEDDDHQKAQRASGEKAQE